MAEDRIKTDRLGGRYMIQDRDHLGEAGQMGGEARNSNARQTEQSHTASRPRSTDPQRGSFQQGGERGYRRREFL